MTWRNSDHKDASQAVTPAAESVVSLCSLPGTRAHPQQARLCVGAGRFPSSMSSRVCSGAVVRRTSAEVRRFVRSPRNRNDCAPNVNVARHASTTTPRNCARTGGLVTVVPWNQNLRRKASLPAPGLVLVGRTFSSLAQPSSTVTTTTKLSVEGGVMTVPLPLPGLPGLTAVSVPVDVAVRDFVKELKALDKSLAQVDIANADGNKVAACTAMQDVATRGFLVSLGGRSRIRVVSEGVRERAVGVPSPKAYELLQAEVVRAGRVTLTRAGLEVLCAKVHREADPENATAKLDPILADAWLQCLVEDGLVFTADKGRVILLNPSGRGVSDEIASALRRDDELIDLKVSGLRQQLDALHLEDARLQAIRDALITRARRTVTLKKGAVLAFMTAQFGVLAYCVYEVYSWDVMEPASYFLMLSYSVGSSIYFSTKNREASFGNLEDVAIKKTEAKLKSAHGYSKSAHEALKIEIKRHHDAVELLSSHRDAHKPLVADIQATLT